MIGLFQSIPHRTLYLLSGRILRFAIHTWLGLMAVLMITDQFSGRTTFSDSQLLEAKMVVFSMIAVALFGFLPWLKSPGMTWQLATSEPGTFRGICNRCAVFLPFVGLAVLIGGGVLWLLILKGVVT
jgi:hypothetical protein